MSIKPSGQELIRGLQRLNPLVPMHDWTVIKAEEPQKNSASYLLKISGESLGALEKAEYKLRFGIRNAKIKVLQGQGADCDNNDGKVKTDDDIIVAEVPGESLGPEGAGPSSSGN